MEKYVCTDCMIGSKEPCIWMCDDVESSPVSCPMGTHGEDAKWERAEGGTQPPQATNTGSPKLPSSTEVWNMIKDFRIDKGVICSVDDLRSVSQAIYEFISRQLRAGA